jgi:hypothetical protein
MRVRLLLAVALIGFTALGLFNVTTHKQRIQLKEVQLQSKSSDLNKLELDFQRLNVDLETELKSKNQNQDHIKQLEEEKAILQQRLDKAQSDLQARAAEKARLAKLQTAPKAYAATLPSTGATTGNCGDNMYKQYIYQHESGCDTNRYNSIGCYGIGQSCPASKIAHCGSNFACQDAWFSNYAITRYGSWAGAYQFWLANKWW